MPTESNTRIFTLEEALATLPLVRRIGLDFAVEYSRLRDFAEQQEYNYDNPLVVEEMDIIEERLNRYASEIQQLGASINDPSLGSIGFFSTEGRIILYNPITQKITIIRPCSNGEFKVDPVPCPVVDIPYRYSRLEQTLPV